MQKMMKILLIDDNSDITEMLSKYLKIEGHNCKVCNDGRNGLSLILEQEFDVVLLDLAMPEFTGYDLVESLEKMGRLEELHKIVVFTASSIGNSEIEKLLQKGVRMCLKKPVRLDQLLNYLEGLNKKDFIHKI